jgi:hypothetical protein
MELKEMMTYEEWIQAVRDHYQVMIDYVKKGVHQGENFSETQNDLITVAMSATGVYYQFKQLPEEFSGAIGPGYQYQRLETNKVIEYIDQIYQSTQTEEIKGCHEFSLMIIYQSPTLDFNNALNPFNQSHQRENLFIFHYKENEQGEVKTIGQYRSGTLPLFFKLKINGEHTFNPLTFEKGVEFFVANMGDSHLLVSIPYKAGVTDLDAVPSSDSIN